MPTLRRQHLWFAAFLVILTLIAVAVVVFGKTMKNVDGTTPCDFIDNSDVERVLGTPGAYASNHRNSREPECGVHLGADILATTIDITVRKTPTDEDGASLVSLGLGLDGAAGWQWSVDDSDAFPDVGRGYLTFRCESGDHRGPVTVTAGAKLQGDEQASYRKLAAALVLGANGIRGDYDCGGGPLPMPDLPDAPPTHSDLEPADKNVCDVFTGNSLLNSLQKAKRWRFWQPPTNDRSPVASCQIWRMPATEAERDNHERIGPGLSFSRITGSAGDRFDLEEFRSGHSARRWRDDLGGDSYVGGSNNLAHYAVKRRCGSSWSVYSGSYSRSATIDRQKFEQLLEQWIRHRAEHDGCPIPQNGS